MALISTMCPRYSERLLLLVTFRYQMHQRAGCILPLLKRWLSAELPSKSSGTIQCLERLALSSFSARPVSGSCTHAHWPRSKLSLQRALSNLSQRWMMWECSLQSPRCFQSAGLLLSSSPTFATVWIWSATINHWKHFMKVNEKNLINWNLCWHFQW